MARVRTVVRNNKITRIRRVAIVGARARSGKNARDAGFISLSARCDFKQVMAGLLKSARELATMTRRITTHGLTSFRKKNLSSS